MRRRLEHHTIDHHVDEVLDLLIQHDRVLIELRDLAVDAHARESFGEQVFEELREFTFAPGYHRRHDDALGLLVFGKTQDIVGHLVGRLHADLASTLRTMRDAHACEEQTQVIVDLGGGSHRRTRILARGLLVDRDRRGKAVDGIEVGFAHLAKEHARIARKAFDIASLTFGIDGIEGKR